MIGDAGWIVSAGTTGFDYNKMQIEDSLEKQVEQAVANIRSYLKEYGATLHDVKICNWIITDRKYFELAGGILKRHFYPNKPVMMTLVCELVDERMKFEMQVFVRP